MKVLLLLFATLAFDTGRVMVATNPAAAAEAVTAVTKDIDPCCPEWLCRILCWWCEPCPPTPGSCETGCCIGGCRD